MPCPQFCWLLRATCLIQWLAFRDDGKYNAADYAKLASERVSRDREGSSWNPFEQGLTTKRRRNFIIKMLQGVVKGLAYLHDHNRLHQSLGPFSVILMYATSNHLILLKIFHLSYTFSPYLLCVCHMIAAQFQKEKVLIWFQDSEI